MIEVRRGHLSWLPRALSRSGSDALSGWRLHNLSTQPVSPFVHLDSKNVFSCVHMSFHVSCVSITSGLVTVKNFSSSLTTPIRYFYILMKSHYIFLTFRMVNLSSLSLSSHDRHSKPLITLVVLCWTFSTKLILLAQRSSKHRHHHPKRISAMLSRGFSSLNIW